MSKAALRRLIAPTFFLLLFLLPALYVDEAILQVSSNLLQRAIRMGRYVIGICLDTARLLQKPPFSGILVASFVMPSPNTWRTCGEDSGIEQTRRAGPR